MLTLAGCLGPALRLGSSSSGLSTGDIVGIVVAIVVGLTLILAAIAGALYYQRRRQQQSLVLEAKGGTKVALAESRDLDIAVIPTKPDVAGSLPLPGAIFMGK